MIPRLVNTYPFTGTGITLTDTISCKVTEERNGAFELEMVVATTTPYFEEIKEGRYILAKPNHTQGAQAFEIYEISRPINQRVTIRAHHISYRLSFIPVEPFSCTGITDTLNGLISHSIETNPFTFTTTITNEQSTYNQTAPASIRSRLGGTEGSVLDVFGGEYLWDNFSVNLLPSRGTDNGVQLRVAKNISALEQTTNLENVVTGALPYWSNEDGTVNLYGDIQYNSHVNDYDYKRTVLLDLSEQFETAPSSTQLNTAAQQYVNQTNLGIVNTNIKLSFVDLADTNEYEGSPLERVNLCDTVTVIYNPLSITYQAKAIRLTYDVLAERTLEVEVGDAKSTIAKTISDLVGDISSVVTVGKKLVSVTQKIDREVGSITQTVASVQETVEDVQGDVGTLQGNVSTLQGDVGELGDSLDGVNTQITTINTNVSNITQTTQSIQTQVTQTQTTLKDVQGDVGTLQGNVSTLQGDVGDLQGDVDDLGDSLDGVNTQITTINNNVSNITQTAQSIQTQVTQTQTTLKDNYATKEQLSSSVSSLSSTIEQTASGINVTISNVQSTVNSQGSQITTLETYIGATSRGLEIGRNTDDVKAVLGNNELAFYDKGNTKLAWLNSDEGLGATGLSIGNATTANQRWRVFTRQNGSHLTFTRHS